MVIDEQIEILKYKHDRDVNWKIAADDIFNVINNYAEKEELSGLYAYFEERYELPASVIKKKIKQHIVRSYQLKSQKFTPHLDLKNIPRSLLNYGALVYGLLFTRKKNEVRNFDLIIDNICSPHELERFKKLVSLFGEHNVLVIARDLDISGIFPNYQTYNKKLFQGIGLADLVKSIYNELFLGVWVVLKASLKSKVNLLPVCLEIIHSYLSAKAIFESNKAQFLIQERHYDTNSVKNYMFKKLGGIAATSIQKNLIQTAPIFFYMDIDVLFSLGSDGYSPAIEYGGRIDHVEPVGSVFMEHYWFKQPNSNHEYNSDKKYDLVVLGINISNGYERQDSYNKFMDDYYGMFRWVAKLSMDMPEYRIVVMHHASAGNDEIEDSILTNSNVIVLDKNLDSYKTAFSSKCAITYGSTMGYELNAHGLPTFFIDPGSRCSYLPLKGCDYIDDKKVSSYDDLVTLMSDIVDRGNLPKITQEISDSFCLSSSDASDRIYNFFINRR